MARAIRRATKRAVSPAEMAAKAAEELADQRFGLLIAGSDFLVEVGGDIDIDVAKMYRLLLGQ